MIRLHIILLILLSSAFSLQGQETIFDEKVGLYTKEHVGGAIIHTNGWGFNYRYGKNLTGSRMRYYELQFVTMKNPKEYKRFQTGDNARGYYYGKLRTFYILQPGYGQRIILFDKIREKGVEVGFVWFAGPSLGLSKPIFVEITNPDDEGTATVDVPYDPAEHQSHNIYGKSRGLHGFGDIAFHPGFLGKVGISFEYSGLDEYIRTLEAGVKVNAYSAPIPIMASNENKQMYISLYLNLLYGKKFYR